MGYKQSGIHHATDGPLTGDPSMIGPPAPLVSATCIVGGRKTLMFLFHSILSKRKLTAIVCTEKRKLNGTEHDGGQVTEGVIDYPDCN